MGRLFLILLIIVLSILILLFTPIFFQTNLHIDLMRKKCAFSLYLYKKIRLLGGYVTTYPGGIALHLSPKKARLLRYKNMNSERKKFSVVKTFHLDEVTLTMETGADYLVATSLIQACLRVYFFAKGGKKEKIENNLWLTDGDVLRISISSEFIFNLYILLCDFVKFLKEKIQILWRKRAKS